MPSRSAALILALYLLAAFACAQPTKAAAPQANDEARIKQIVDGIMQPYLAQTGAPGAIVGVSLHGHRYYFPYGKATDAGAPFASDTLVEIGSCTKTFTTTLFALAIGRNQIDPNASAQQYMPSGYTLRPEAAEDDAAGVGRLHLRHARRSNQSAAQP